MKSFSVVLIVLVATLGCSSSQPTIVAPDGGPAIPLHCATMAQCYTVAGRRCPHGYEKLDESTKTESRRGLMNAATLTTTDWLIRCR